MTQANAIDNNINVAKTYVTPMLIDLNANNGVQEGLFAQGQNVDVNEELTALNEKLETIENENGCFLKAWDKVKCATNLGTSSEKCEDAIEKYKNGELSYDEAMKVVDKYDRKQDNSLNLISNIVTSIAAIGVTTAVVAAVAATGGAALPLVAIGAIGAATGGVTKAGFKLFERATNKVENDELDAKQIAKDGLSGAVTGAIASVTMGTAGSTYSAEATLTQNVAKGATRCAKRNFVSGAASGAANYAIDTSFDENKKFDGGEFIQTTAENAIVGGIVGGIMGTANTIYRANGLVSSGGQVGIEDGVAKYTSGRDIAANSVCTAEYKLTTRMINDGKEALKEAV